MYSRSTRNYSRQQYATPARNGPRFCNQCQAPLSCHQLAYCPDCCYCKACTSQKRRLSRGHLLSASERIPTSPAIDEPLFGLNELYSSGEELDRAIDTLEESQKSLRTEFDQFLANRKRKLTRADAMLGPAAKKIRDFIEAGLPLPPVDAEAVKSELSQRKDCLAGDCKCPEGTHP